MIHKIPVTIQNQRAIGYPIFIGAGLYDFRTWLPKQNFTYIVIITDRFVKKYYGLNLQKHLNEAGYTSLLFSFPAGEKFKNYRSKQAIEHAMQRHRCDKDTLILALGGGVVGDLAGYIAATYLRGIPYIQIPTTLLAMVDSSVGGKTAINTMHGKNLIGAIYQPLCVVADIMLLKTLSRKNIINGLIEAVKMFLTHDAVSFRYTESHLHHIINGDDSLLIKIVARAVRIKAAVVARDEKELDERSMLNFGHTIGHALEKLSHYSLLHGYAVGYGILVEATIAHILGLLNHNHLLIIKKVLAQLGIQGKDLQKYNVTKLIKATKNDKKNRFGKVHYTLLREIGQVYFTKSNFVHPVEDKIVRQAFRITREG